MVLNFAFWYVKDLLSTLPLCHLTGGITTLQIHVSYLTWEKIINPEVSDVSGFDYWCIKTGTVHHNVYFGYLGTFYCWHLTIQDSHPRYMSGRHKTTTLLTSLAPAHRFTEQSFTEVPGNRCEDVWSTGSDGSVLRWNAGPLMKHKKQTQSSLCETGRGRKWVTEDAQQTRFNHNQVQGFRSDSRSVPLH